MIRRDCTGTLASKMDSALEGPSYVTFTTWERTRHLYRGDKEFAENDTTVALGEYDTLIRCPT